MIARLVFIGLSLAIGLSGYARAQEDTPFWPDVTYDPAIPTIEEVLGHGPGERIAPPADLVRYLEALAEVAPDRVRLETYAHSWQGRPLVYAVLGSAAHMANLTQLQQGYVALRNAGETSPEDAQRIIASAPATVWLTYGVHGDEISSPNAALLTAYHLLAAQGDATVERIRENTLVFIDPTQNPDGRARFIHHFEAGLGLAPDPFPYAAEHTEPWPSGRMNHYLFDMNRDWFAQTQPETIGRTAAMLRWYPQVVVDLHEMGANSTYYFGPPAQPYNPHYTDAQEEGFAILGKNDAYWFDRFGIPYFTREIFDAFFPGYGDSWPMYYGAIAFTYEQASAGGLLYRRNDGTDLTFRDGVRHHFVASIATADGAAKNREWLLESFYDYQVSAIEEGASEDIRAYVLPREGDTAAVDKLAGLLVRQDVDVQRATEAFTVEERTFPAGSYVIDLAQPAKRLVRTLLDSHVPMAEDFVEEQENRRAENLPDQIYDVTAWSVPLAYNVEAVPLAAVPSVSSEAASAALVRPGAVVGDDDAVAYLVPWGTAAAGRLLTAAIRDGLKVWSTDKAFTQEGREFPRGTLIIRTHANPNDLRDRLTRIAAESGADVVATDTSWVEDGPNFGSGNVVYMGAPRIALAWDAPTSPYSAGATRFVLERQFGYPVTVIRTKHLLPANLSAFNVLILPSGSYADELGEAGGKKLQAWVKAGGTLVTLEAATSYAASKKGGLLDSDEELLAHDGEDDEKKEAKKDEDDEKAPGTLLTSAEELKAAIRPEDEEVDSASGAIAEASTHPEHWLTAGVPDTVYVLARGNAIFTPLTIDKGINAVTYAGPEDLLASGHLWEENRKQLAFKPVAMVQGHGKGHVVGFTVDPNHRAAMDGLNVLFLNAVFRGAAHGFSAEVYR